MTEALIRNPSAALCELVVDAKARAELVNAIARACERSFLEDACQNAGVRIEDVEAGRVKLMRMATRTQSEERRRVAICLDLVERLRGDEGWSVIHVRDAMQRALRSMLDSGRFDSASERLVWTPS